MGFRGQESALGAKWESLRDDVHDAERRAHEVLARVGELELAIHRLEQPVSAAAFRAAMIGVLVIVALTAPSVTNVRPGLGETVEPILASFGALFAVAGGPVGHWLLGRHRFAIVSLVLRAPVFFWLPWAFGWGEWLPPEVTLVDVLAFVAFAECAWLLTLDRTLRRPTPPHAPSPPTPPLASDEPTWRRHVEELERRVHFAHERSVAAAGREPALRDHLASLRRRANASLEHRFDHIARMLGSALFLLVGQGLHEGFGTLGTWCFAAFFLPSTVLSLRTWSSLGLSWVAFVFVLTKAACFTVEPWIIQVVAVRWLELLGLVVLEPIAHVAVSTARPARS